MSVQPGTPTAVQTPGQTEAQNGEGPQALKTWWTGFKRRGKKDQAQAAAAVAPPAGIFGVDLQTSIKYANVAISLLDDNGEQFIYGYVPIVVAKCGVFLKEKATDVQGIFRLSGSNKRIKELQQIFDSPDRFGKGLDWTGYTVHDAANILRRYLNQLPQPIIPLDFYEKFRDPLRSHQTQAVGDMEAQAQDIGDFDQEKAIETYVSLIKELPPLNRQLLLYILDLLAVFASKSDINLMTSANLSAIFQPGLLSHPAHDMAPQEYRLSQDVLIFLIDNQDNFLIGMKGTAADEATVRDVQNAVQTQTSQPPSTPSGVASALGRSASTASAGADSVRKYGGLRRNVSVSSKNSRQSSNVPSPVTPSSGTAFASNNTGSGVYRSNTMPSKRSPGLPSPRFNKGPDSPNSSPMTVSPGSQPIFTGIAQSAGSKLAPSASERVAEEHSGSVTPTAKSSEDPSSSLVSTGQPQSNDILPPNERKEPQLPTPVEQTEQLNSTPSRVRGVATLLNLSPSDNDRKDKPKKLQKRRIPSSATPSAHSSTNSLPQTSDSVYTTPMPTPGYLNQVRMDPLNTAAPALNDTPATPQLERPPPTDDAAQGYRLPSSEPHSTLQPQTSPVPSLHSKSSVTDHSDGQNDTTVEKPAKSRWRFSASARKDGQSISVPGSAHNQLGSNVIAEKSTSSIGSWRQARKSFTNDTQPTFSEATSAGPSTTNIQPNSSNESAPKEMGSPEKEEKKGPFGWVKAKLAQAKEERKEREAEKERTKSPLRNEGDRYGSKNSLSAVAHDPVLRGRSIDMNRAAKPENEIKYALAPAPTSPTVTAPTPTAEEMPANNS